MLYVLDAFFDKYINYIVAKRPNTVKHKEHYTNTIAIIITSLLHKYTNIDKCRELVTSKPPTTSTVVSVYIEQLSNKPLTSGQAMYKNAHLQAASTE